MRGNTQRRGTRRHSGPNARNETVIRRVSEQLILDIKAGGLFVGALNFKLSNLPGYTEFDLFDQYKIENIIVRVCPTFVTNVVKGVLGNDITSLPLLTTCIDKDDSNTPAGINTLLENSTCQNHGALNHVITRTLKPQISVAAYQGAFTGYSAVPSPWIDISSSGVEHYGFKYAIENAPVSATSNLVVFYVDYTLRLRYPV